MLELRSENDIKLQIKGVEKRGNQTEMGKNGYTLAGFDHFKSEILPDLERVKNKDLEDMVYRKELTYDEIVDILDARHIAGSATGYTLPLGIHEIGEINLIINSLLPKR